jgi:hypothetical protein
LGYAENGVDGGNDNRPVSIISYNENRPNDKAYLEISSELFNYVDRGQTRGLTLNKFDVFDADGLTKSAGSVIARTALQFAPFLIPGVRE